MKLDMFENEVIDFKMLYSGSGGLGTFKYRLLFFLISQYFFMKDGLRKRFV